MDFEFSYNLYTIISDVTGSCFGIYPNLGYFFSNRKNPNLEYFKKRTAKARVEVKKSGAQKGTQSPTLLTSSGLTQTSLNCGAFQTKRTHKSTYRFGTLICDKDLNQTSSSLTGIMSHLAQLKAGLRKSYNLSISSVSTT